MISHVSGEIKALAQYVNRPGTASTTAAETILNYVVGAGTDGTGLVNYMNGRSVVWMVIFGESAKLRRGGARRYMFGSSSATRSPRYKVSNFVRSFFCNWLAFGFKLGCCCA
ncbi:hypothetical protein GWI33_009719 [Rhynchophorus ferrugineus]|uniref:Uncharacterized protein n=1 Tax=Rhynchophorus ferrugineus TaxID=354439 RepID=A0A834M9K0_RHYFE|nr:hypothetical protein GWI33_009719 [Rhynchophorus ferrugineus]